MDESIGKGTLLLHGDDEFLNGVAAIAPPISVSTTFRHPVPSYDEPDLKEDDFDPYNPQNHVYSRYTQPTLTRAEKVLEKLLGNPAILYGSGLTATFAVLMHLMPDTIAITKGYHGCHETINRYLRLRGGQAKVIDLDDEYTDPKTVCWLETPLNPTGECRDAARYRAKVSALNSPTAYLVVDSTFGPPPLQDPFKWGADYVMHSCTKYFAGHSDVLMGMIICKSQETWAKMWEDRTYLGLTPGSLEAWLVLRSLRTLHLRVPRQSQTATELAIWLNSLTKEEGSLIEMVTHAVLQETCFVGEGKQMESGPATFSVLFKKPFYAKHIPHLLNFFTAATSLGGVESLIEQRVISSPGEDPRLVRISVGLEDFKDLKADMIQAFSKVKELEIQHNK